jgi:branched-chain amino acid transport system ATP-binding protein
MLRIDSATVLYGKALALNRINLSVGDGEFVSIIGSNGAGKTTLLKMISGLKRPDAGMIFFKGERIDSLVAYKIVRKGISLCPERSRIAPKMTVMENLELGAYLRNDQEGINGDFRDVFVLFPRLKERANQLGGTLSGGEQQMLALGRALMARPKLLMLDEPSLGLAPLLKKEIFEKIREIGQKGITILLVEQEATFGLRIAQRAYVLENGRIVLEGPVTELIRNKLVQESYLGI